MSKKIKVEKKHRIAWINLASAYIHAGDTISKKIKRTFGELDEQWRNQVMVIPLLYLLRHSLELSIKSLFISHDLEFENEHNLNTLMKEAEKIIDIKNKSKNKKERWSEMKNTVKEFADTTYGGKRLFTKNDINSSALRYLQTDTNHGYSELKNINHTDLITKVKRARAFCEILTLETQIKYS